jgi:predicted type IV restriction endonuclease
MELNLPSYAVRKKKIENGEMLFDRWRNKWIKNTPEEWVRQHFCNYLCVFLGYPAGRMVLEGSAVLNGIKGRWDVLIYDADKNARLLIECKAPGIAINQKVLDQASRYYHATGVQYTILTNGLQHYCLENTKSEWKFRNEIPDYETVCGINQ